MVELPNLINLKIKTIKLNGLMYQYKPPMNVLQLLLYLGFNVETVIVDYNGSVLQKEYWPYTELNTHDIIEILTVAGGG